jgi:uncharacterized membrane protein
MAVNDEGKLWAFLAYLLSIIGFILVMVLQKKNKFAMFHAKQSLVLFIAWIVISVVGAIIPVVGWALILPLGSVFVVVLWVMGMINALTGKQKELWFIGKYADKLDF